MSNNRNVDVLRIVNAANKLLDEIAQDMSSTNVNMHPIKYETIRGWNEKLQQVKKILSMDIPKDAIILVRMKRPSLER